MEVLTPSETIGKSVVSTGSGFRGGVAMCTVFMLSELKARPSLLLISRFSAPFLVPSVIRISR